LRKETFDQSLDRLLDDQPYFYPSYFSARLVDQLDLEVMLSCRPCIKIFYEIKSLPPAQRDAKCAAVFDFIFPIHAKMIRESLRGLDEPDAFPLKYSLKATRLGVGAAMFATAEYGTTETLLRQFKNLKDLTKEADAKIAARGDQPVAGPPIFWYKGNDAPDHRMQFNILALRMERAGSDAAKAVWKKKFSHLPMKGPLPIVHWDAHTTTFDVPHRMEGIPLDESKGLVHYTFRDFPSPQADDWEWCRQLVNDARELLGQELP
jgi:hypothetical protein